MPTFTESVVEDASLAWLGELGYTVAHGPDIGPMTAALAEGFAVDGPK